MYSYYIAHHIGQCPIYLCTGTKDERAVFKQDVEKNGLATRDLEAVCIAVDILNSGLHNDCLEYVCSMIMTEHGNIPETLLQDKKDGPFPAERTFSIPTVWQMIGRVITKAKTMEEALDKAISAEALPQESYYLDESQEVDLESGIEVK